MTILKWQDQLQSKLSTSGRPQACTHCKIFEHTIDNCFRYSGASNTAETPSGLVTGSIVDIASTSTQGTVVGPSSLHPLAGTSLTSSDTPPPDWRVVSRKGKDQAARKSSSPSPSQISS